MNFETAAALQNAYAVFARYKDSYDFARQSGVSHSLAQLTRDDWDEIDKKFDMGVQLFSDDSTLLRHFLPRFLEWISDDSPSPLFELWDLGYRLNHAQWLKWPEEEVEALRAVFEAWTREISPSNEDQVPIDFLLEVKDDLSRYLNIWLEVRPHQLAQWLWKVDWKKQEKVRLWVAKPHVEETLEAEFFRHPDGERAQALSRSIELIRSLRG